MNDMRKLMTCASDSASCAGHMATPVAKQLETARIPGPRVGRGWAMAMECERPNGGSHQSFGLRVYLVFSLLDFEGYTVIHYTVVSAAWWCPSGEKEFELAVASSLSSACCVRDYISRLSTASRLAHPRCTESNTTLTES